MMNKIQSKLQQDKNIKRRDKVSKEAMITKIGNRRTEEAVIEIEMSMKRNRDL
jgi:hypothetical protein